MRPAAFGQLPAIRIKGKTMLADKHRHAFRVDRQHADGDMLEFDDAINARRAVGTRYIMVGDSNPWILIDDLARSYRPWPYASVARRLFASFRRTGVMNWQTSATPGRK